MNKSEYQARLSSLTSKKLKMSRSLIIGILVTLLLISGLAAVFYNYYIQDKEKPLFDGIPNDAAIILETKDIHTGMAEVFASPLWNDLKQNEHMLRLSKQVLAMDSLLMQQPYFREILQSKRVAISFHARSQISMLLVTHAGDDGNWMENLAQLAQSQKWKINRRIYEKNTILDLLDQQLKPICSISFKDNLILCSADGNLVEDALVKMRYKLVNAVNRLEQVTALSKNGSDFNLYINHAQVSGLINTFLKEEFKSTYDFLARFANWSLLNIQLEDAHISMSGLTVTDDSLYQYLDLFGSQSPVVSNLDAYMPDQTALKIQLGFSDYGRFKGELTEYLQQLHIYSAYDAYRDSLERLYGIDLGSDFENMLGNQVALAGLEYAGNDLNQNLFVVIKPAQVSYAEGLLKRYLQKCQLKSPGDSASTELNASNRLPFGNFLKCYFGKMFESIHSPYFAIVKDVVVFANNSEVLKRIKEQVESGNTLLNNPDYTAFRKKTGESFNFQFFIQTSMALRFTSSYSKETFYSQLNRFANDYRKFQFLQLQYSSSSDKAFYTQVDIKYNSVYKVETRMIWEAQLDTSLEGYPAVISNPSMNQNSIWVQDKKNTLYAFNRDGMLQWKAPLSGKILSPFQAVDFGENGTVEYFFTTENQAYLIDMHGNPVFGYPVRFPGKAVSAGHLIDPYGDSAFQWYIPLSNNRIAGYSLEGRPLKGWNPKQLPATPVSEVLGFTLGTQPMIYTTLSNGVFQLFKITGERVDLKLTKALPGTSFRIKSADTAAATLYYTDTLKQPVKLTVSSDGSLSPEQVFYSRKVTEVSAFWYSPEKDYYFLNTDSTGTTLFNAKGQTLGSYPLQDSLPVLFFLQFTEDGKLITGQTRSQSNQLYLYEPNGRLHSDFPLQGNTRFYIYNLYGDGVRYLITGEGKNYLRTYRLK